MSALETIRSAIAAHTQKSNKKLRTLHEKQRILIRASTIQCTKCKRRSQLCLWVFIQDHWYTQPHSCTEGDYWTPSKPETCHMVCPRCEAENYIYNHPQKEKILRLIALVEENSLDMESVFKEITERHTR